MKKADVIEYYGSGSAAGRALGLKRQTVSAWPELVPELQARRYHEKTRGRLRFDPADYPIEADAALSHRVA